MEKVQQNIDTTNCYDRRGLLAGVVSLIKVFEGDHTFKKGEKPVFISQSGNKAVVALDIRKVIFEENKGYGEDVFYSIKREGYKYKIIGFAHDQYENNTIVIRNPRCLNDVLYYAGVPTCIDELNMGGIRKMLLSSEEVLRVKRHKEELTENGIIEPQRLREINSQASFLYNFKKLDLPTTPQKIEKVYAKHFK